MVDKSPLLDVGSKAPKDPQSAFGIEPESPPYTYYPQQQHMPYVPYMPYYPPQPANCPQMGQQQINVVTVQPTPPVAPKQTTVVVRSSNETAERAILFSMINAICCNLFFGIIAMFIALAAKDYIKNGREEEGRRLIRAASIINIVGVISSAVIVLTVIIVLATS